MPAPQLRSQVVIVGAGPAGSAIAHLLAQHPIQVILVEQETNWERVFRGEGLMPSGIEALQAMGVSSLLDTIPAAKLTAWDFWVDGQRRMRVWEPQAELGDRTSRIFSPAALLKSLVEPLRRLPNVTVLTGCRAKGLQWQGNRVTGVEVRDGEGDRLLPADGVIAADGRYSRLRHWAGLPLYQDTTQFDVLWFKLPAPPSLLAETVFTVCLQRSRQFAFYPSWDGKIQLGWIVAKGQGKHPPRHDWIEEFAPAVSPELADYWRQHRDLLEGPTLLDVIVGHCPQWSVPGLLLVGDAAHPMAPNRAQGINMALRDAIAVANHLIPRCLSQPGCPIPHESFQAVQRDRQTEISAVQKLQLAEWQKIAHITANPWTYSAFRLLLSLLGRLPTTQALWLHQQKGLRYGLHPIHRQGF